MSRRIVRCCFAIDQVPEGTPVGRLAEIVAMLAMPNVQYHGAV